MSSENNETSEPHRLLLKLSKREINVLPYQILALTVHRNP